MKIIDKLIEKPTANVRIVALGDSVTAGFFESRIEMHGIRDLDNSYLTKLVKNIKLIFPDANINAINSGVGGECAKNALDRLDRDLLSLDPDLAIVCFGLNDVNSPIEEYHDSLDKIFKAANEKGIETIYMTQNMFNTYPSDKIVGDWLRDYSKKTAKMQNDGLVDKLFAEGIKTAKENGIMVCDVYSCWKELQKKGIDTTALLANYINHPKREMHNLYAQKLFETIFSL